MKILKAIWHSLTFSHKWVTTKTVMDAHGWCSEIQTCECGSARYWWGRKDA